MTYPPLQYNAGTLVIRFNNSALVPSGVIIVDITEEEDDEEEELPKWLIPAASAAVAAVVILSVLIAVFVSGKSDGFISPTHFIDALYIYRWALFTSAAVETRNLMKRSYSRHA